MILIYDYNDDEDSDNYIHLLTPQCSQAASWQCKHAMPVMHNTLITLCEGAAHLLILMEFILQLFFSLCIDWKG